MPELPEVENICRDIQENLKNNPVVEKINVHQRKLRQIVPVKLVSLLEGQCFKNIRRRAKYLIFEFSDGIMISHLGMTGSWSFVGSDYQKEKHDHIFIFFSNGKIMVYSDPRRFGFLDWVRAGKLNTNK